MDSDVSQLPSSPTSSSYPQPGSDLHCPPGDAVGNSDPAPSWLECVSKARSRVNDLSSILVCSSSLSVLADSDRPARSLLTSSDAYSALSAAFSSPTSGSGSDPLCQWLYDTFQYSDPDLCLVVLSVVPLLCGVYLSRVVSSPDPSPSLAGFEAVLLSIYASEAKARGGMPVRVTIPDISKPSLYHTLREHIAQNAANADSKPSIRVVSPPLEPLLAMKSTKRACVIGVALDCYYKRIWQMPSWSKVDLCKCAAAWAGQSCPCRNDFDDSEGDVTERDSNTENEGIENGAKETTRLAIEDVQTNLDSKSLRIPLPWELLQPILKIVGHCLLAPLIPEDVRDAASTTIRCLYARSSHDIAPQAILATKSLIQLEKRSRATSVTPAVSNANAPRKSRGPEVLLVSK